MSVPFSPCPDPPRLRPGHGSVRLVLGCMFAGKTSELRRDLETHTLCGMNALLVRSAVDTRGGADKGGAGGAGSAGSADNASGDAGNASGDADNASGDASSAAVPPPTTHRSLSLGATGDTFVAPALAPRVRTVRVARLADVVPAAGELFVAVDEGQFFPDLAETCRAWAASGRTVVVAALNGKADRSPWPSVSDLIPEASDITLLPAVCATCRRPDRKASFSVRHTGKASISGVDVGGAERYSAICRICLDGAAT